MILETFTLLSLIILVEIGKVLSLQDINDVSLAGRLGFSHRSDVQPSERCQSHNRGSSLKHPEHRNDIVSMSLRGPLNRASYYVKEHLGWPMKKNSPHTEKYFRSLFK